MAGNWEEVLTPQQVFERAEYERKHGGPTTRETNLKSVEELLGIKDEYFETGMCTKCKEWTDANNPCCGASVRMEGE